MAEAIAQPGKNRITLYIIIALLLGIVGGFGLNKSYVYQENERISMLDNLQETVKEQLNLIKDSNSAAFKILIKQNKDAAAQKAKTVEQRDKKLEPFSLLADIFLRLIKMIIAPLVFSTLVVGIAKQADIRAIGRIGGKTLLWFLSASILSLFLGMLLVNFFRPGEAMHIPLPDVGADSGISKTAFTLKDFLYHVFPSSLLDAMAKNEILQIVIFSIIFGIATSTLGETGYIIVKALDAVSHVVLKMTSYIMMAAPLAVFGAMCAVIAKQGLGILGAYSIFIGEVYFGLLILWVLLISAGAIFLKGRVFSLLRHIREPILVAFSTSSSEAAFPKTMLELERFGCRNRVVSFVLPLGYSFNLDGSMMYMTFASLFIAQSYGIHLDFATQANMFFVLMLTSKGVAGVPRVGLVVIAGTLSTFNIPEAGIALLLGIDPLLDMGRSATNVVGNSIATAVVDSWEKGQ